MLRTAPLALIAVLALAACGGDRRPEETASVQATGERLVVRESLVADLKPVAATVTTRDMGEARARIGGTLVRLAVREGDQVRKGQVIAVVSDPRLGFETGAYEAQVAAAAAEATRADAELKRIQTLYDQGVYAKARLEQAEAAARAARGALDAARAQRAAAAELVSQGAILAPTDGRVLRADVPAGSVVAPGQSVATITAGEPLLRLEIPEAQARALRVGDAVSIETEDLPGVAPSGVIAQVYPAVTAGRVVADIKAAGLDARLVGQRVRVRVKVGERRALIVPQKFVSTRHGLDFARLVTGKGETAEVAVQLAPGPAAGQVEVLSGLTAGDTLVARKAAS
ncbi:MAG: efflux RND transporter periplasmic adaptor subunit [Pseudomonadota bacterium]